MNSNLYQCAVLIYLFLKGLKRNVYLSEKKNFCLGVCVYLNLGYWTAFVEVYLNDNYLVTNKAL